MISSSDGFGVLREERGARDHEARRAEAALQRVLLDEGLLQRAHLLRRAEALDGRDLVPLGVGREHQAGLHRLAVEQHRAAAAAAAVAHLLGARQVEVVAQRVEQRDARLDGELPDRAVHLEAQRDGLGPEDLGAAAAPPAAPTTVEAAAPTPAVFRKLRREKPGWTPSSSRERCLAILHLEPEKPESFRL